MTSFQKKVYSVVKKIPRGSVLTYKKIAAIIGHPLSWRAVGNALNRNEQLEKIPCHRVVKSNGEIGGYKYGRKKKLLLLKKEGVKIKNNKVIFSP
jgi:O-6-methylguanine DNA methyltransferase